MTVITTLLMLLLAGNLKSELDGLIEAERAFARLSLEKGSRDAFLANLSDESILFRPGPVPGKQWMEKSEAVTTQLSWQPEFADISSAADLGFTTGPWEFRRTPQESPAAYGRSFYSIDMLSVGPNKFKVVDKNLRIGDDEMPFNY